MHGSRNKRGKGSGLAVRRECYCCQNAQTCEFGIGSESECKQFLNCDTQGYTFF